MTARTRAAAAALVVLLLGAIAFFVSSPAPPPTETTDRAAAADVKKDAPREPSVPRRARAADAPAETPVVEVPPADPDPSKWPIRVTTNVPGAQVTMQVRLYGGDPDPAPEAKTTDAKGFAGFAAPAKEVPVHRFEFVARAEGFATMRARVDGPGDVRICLLAGIAVCGVVRDATGKPIAGATLLGAAGSTWIGDVDPPTSADGTFEAFAPSAGPVSFSIHHDAFLRRDVEADAPAAGLVVVLDRGLEVCGRVAFPDGRPLPGVGVRDESGAVHASTDEDGRYVLSGVARGSITVRCEMAGESRTVEAGATGVDFAVKRSVARVRYLDAKGRPFRCADVMVRVVKDGDVLEMYGGQGPDDGIGFFDGPPGAQVLVAATARDGRTGSGTATFDATARLHDVDVVIGGARPTGTIRLVVRWESVEIPKTVYVAVSDATGSVVAGDARKRCDLDAAAAIEIPNVPAGHVTVRVAAAAHWSGEALDTMLVTATPSADVEVGRTTEIVANLLVGGRVRATVRDENGAAVTPDVVRLLAAPKGREIDMFVRRTAEGFTSELDATPSVLIDAVAPGRYVVQTKGPEGDEVSKDVEVVRGETADVVLTVKAKR